MNEKEKLNYLKLAEKLRGFSQFGSMLSFYIKSRLITGKVLAEKMAVSPATVSHWITGRRFPDASAIYWVVKALYLDEEEALCLLNASNGDIAARQLASFIEVAVQQNDVDMILRLSPSLLEKIEISIKESKSIRENYSEKKLPFVLERVCCEIFEECGLDFESVKREGEGTKIVATFQADSDKEARRRMRDVKTRVDKRLGKRFRRPVHNLFKNDGEENDLMQPISKMFDC